MHSSACKRWPRIPSGEDGLTSKSSSFWTLHKLALPTFASATLLLCAFFADWLAVSWYFLFQIYLFTQTRHSSALWLGNHFFFFGWLCASCSVVDGMTLDFSMGNLISLFSDMESERLTKFQIVTRNTNTFIFILDITCAQSHMKKLGCIAKLCPSSRKGWDFIRITFYEVITATF